MGKNYRIALRGSSGGFSFSLLVFLVFCTTTSGKPALAQDAPGACNFGIARVVSIQGSVEVRRAGSTDWARIRRLDTPLCAGDQLRAGPLSRAALFVQPETLVRVDQYTTIALSQTTTEILVEHFQDEVSQAGRDAHACGASYFITRYPKKFKVSTPQMNAAVEGTEFQVVLRCESTELAVLEGAVRSETLATREERTLTGGQMLVAGPSGPAVFSTLIKPADAVQWVLYYPPLSDAKTEDDVPNAEQCRGLPTPSDQTCLTQRAEVLLRLGRSEEALRDINEALALNPANGDANALRAIIHIARNDKAAALESATAATASAPNSYRGWLALSYAQQASFELEQALEGARKAQALEPNSSLINARVAELLMSLGRIDEAEASAGAGVNANPAESRAHTMLGFVHLAQIDTKQARADFEAAIERDSFNPLSRLGLGLAMIRDGKLLVGREQLEIAVALDPTNSLLRSYVGKAYYEENTRERDQLAESQFKLAKELDPNDPTPWFYDAIHRYADGRPIDAAAELQMSIALNDRRAPYRSRLLIDADSATRSATVAQIYSELGFDQLAFLEAARALSDDALSPVAHRLLGDAYATLPRHEIARESELLQSQLFETPGVRRPASFRLAPVETGIPRAGILLPAAFAPVGQNEFSRLFDRNGFALFAEGIVGSANTLGGELAFSGLMGSNSLSAALSRFETDGFAANRDFRQDTQQISVHSAVSHSTTLLLDFAASQRLRGDFLTAFDPTFTEPLRLDEDSSTYRLAGRHSVSASSHIVFNVAYQSFVTDMGFPVFDDLVKFDDESTSTELQFRTSHGPLSLIAGSTYLDGKLGSETFLTGVFFDSTTTNTSYWNTYLYGRLQSTDRRAALHLGLSGDYFDEGPLRVRRANPRIGILWLPTQLTTVRVVAMRSLSRPFVGRQTIEPTQIVGFNQFFDDPNGSSIERYGAGLDYQVHSDVYLGAEASKRHLSVPLIVGSITERFGWSDGFARAYLYAMRRAAGERGCALCWGVALSFEYQYEYFNRPPELPGNDGLVDITNRMIPIKLELFPSQALKASIGATHVAQYGIQQVAVFTDQIRVDQDFWIWDASSSYRLPHRRGFITAGVSNIFDHRHDFRETDPLNPRFIPERFAYARLQLEFQ